MPRVTDGFVLEDPLRLARRRPARWAALAAGAAAGAALAVPGPVAAADASPSASPSPSPSPTPSPSPSASPAPSPSEPPGPCAAPVPSSTQPGYLVADPGCDVDGETPFVPLTDVDGVATTRTYAGIAEGAAYRIEVPLDWDGTLLLWAHGYRGEGTTVHVDSPQLRGELAARGIAWAASSYERNSYDVQQGVDDTYELLDLVPEVVDGFADGLDRVVLNGASMGGHITAVLPEQHPDAVDAIYPVCGVLGDYELFDYFVDATTTAAALAGADGLVYDYSADPGAFAGLVADEVVPELFTERPALTQEGQAWSAAVERRSGGDRPGFDGAFAYWSSFGFGAPPLGTLPFLFGVYPGLTGGTNNGLSSGNVAGNAGTVYELDDAAPQSPAERALNAEVLRVQADPDATGVPRIAGTPGVPVLSLHDIGDLFVPFSMEQVYARETGANGEAFVSRAIRGVAHCDFTDAELAKGLDDLLLWEQTGRQPAGDPVNDPAAVAAATFGCRFTTEGNEQARAPFTAAAPPCPTFPDVAGSVHAGAIRSLLGAGVVAGFPDGTYGPRLPVTRGQLATVVSGAGDLPDPGGATGFDDVAPGQVHAEGVRTLVAAGAVDGFRDGTFRPNQPVSRGQVAKVLASLLDVESTRTDCFADLGSSVHAADVCALADLGLAAGFGDGTYGPDRAVTRGQAASLVTRALG